MVNKIRVLIVDDSAVYRLALRRVLDGIENCQVIGLAEDGRKALAQIDELKPDLVTLDIEMPDMNGIQVLKELKKRGDNTKVIVLSKYSASGAQVTIDALMEGAMDAVCKPSFRTPAENQQYLRTELTERINALMNQDRQPRPDPQGGAVVDQRLWSCSALVIGSSTGGPEVLRRLLGEIPEGFPLPIIIVQHIPAVFSASLANRLDGICPLTVVEAEDGMPLELSRVYVAPGGHQSKLVTKMNQILFEVNDDPAVNNCRPAVDYTLSSASEILSGQVLAVILTGMGRDGLKGCERLRSAGGRVIAQHAEGCTVYGMPKAVIEAGLANRISSIDKMAEAISLEIKSGS